MRVLRLAFLWAAAASAIGVVVWSLLAGIVWSLVNPDSTIWRTLAYIPLAILGSGYWALFIGLVALPAYTVILAVWIAVVQRKPGFESSIGKRFAATCVLSLPPIILLTHGFASSIFGFNWMEAARTFPLAAISCVTAIWAPRRLIRPLRQSLGALAF